MISETVCSKNPYEDSSDLVLIKAKKLQYQNCWGETETEMKETAKIVPKFRFHSGRIRLISHSLIPFEERVKAARAKIRKMNKEERWRLIEESFGMWESYPGDWLIRMREGTLQYKYSTESQIITYAISR